jgi:hypothetical protein
MPGVQKEASLADMFGQIVVDDDWERVFLLSVH